MCEKKQHPYHLLGGTLSSAAPILPCLASIVALLSLLMCDCVYVIFFPLAVRRLLSLRGGDQIKLTSSKGRESPIFTCLSSSFPQQQLAFFLSSLSHRRSIILPIIIDRRTDEFVSLHRNVASWKMPLQGSSFKATPEEQTVQMASYFVATAFRKMLTVGQSFHVTLPSF